MADEVHQHFVQAKSEPEEFTHVLIKEEIDLEPTHETQMKRIRGSNFSTMEKVLLLKLVSKYKEIVECRRTDSGTIKAKDDAWEKIRIQFNSNTQGSKRSLKQLRQFYTNAKRPIKKPRTEESGGMYKTNGGRHTTNISDSLLLALIQDRTESSTSENDHAADYYREDGINRETRPSEGSGSIGIQVSFVHEESEPTTPSSCTSTSPFPLGKHDFPSLLPPPSSKNEISACNVEDDVTMAKNEEQLSSSHKHNSSLCQKTITSFPESSVTLCETEMVLLKKKHENEMELIEMKKESERLKQEVLRMKLTFYKEKTKRLDSA